MPLATVHKLASALDSQIRQGLALLGASDSSTINRLVTVHQVIETLEGLFEAGAHNKNVCVCVARCRQLLENFRVKTQHELAVQVLDPELGLTEDVCFFMAVALCDAIMIRGALGGIRLIPDQTWTFYATESHAQLPQ